MKLHHNETQCHIIELKPKTIFGYFCISVRPFQMCVQKDAECKDRTVFDIPIFTEEFLNHSKGEELRRGTRSVLFECFSRVGCVQEAATSHNSGQYFKISNKCFIDSKVAFLRRRC